MRSLLVAFVVSLPLFASFPAVAEDADPNAAAAPAAEQPAAPAPEAAPAPAPEAPAPAAEAPAPVEAPAAPAAEAPAAEPAPAPAAADAPAPAPEAPAAAAAGDAPAYVGTWAEDPAQCGKQQDDQDAPMVVTKDRFDQHEAHCEFKAVSGNNTGNEWKVTSECTVEGDKQPYEFGMSVADDKLAMVDDAGTHVYSRCAQ